MAKSPKQKPITANRNTPSATAAEFRALRDPTLMFHNGDWLRWNAGAYNDVEEKSVRSAVRKYLGAAFIMRIDGRTEEKTYQPFNPTNSDVTEVVAALSELEFVPRDTMSPPCWLDGAPPELAALDPKSLISCRNGILDLDTRTLYPPTSLFFTRTALEIDYDPNAEQPEVWHRFLDQTMQGRSPLIQLIQEMFGYCISTDNSLHKVFFLLGRPRSGKGTILRTMTQLVGKRNVCFPQIEKLGGQFGLEDLIGKSLAQVTDLNTEARGHLGTAASRLNAISGEDGMSIERKNKTAWSGELPIRVIMAGNTMPNFGSHALALVARLLIVPFEVSFAGREDRKLDAKIKAELSGILNWALDGLDALRAREEFEEPAESIVAKGRLLNKADAVYGFVNERCIVTGNDASATEKPILYREFLSYCEEVGVRQPPALKDFTEKLQTLFPEVTNTRPRVGKGQRPGRYVGIEFDAETALRYYATAPDYDDLIELGFLPSQAIKRDKLGAPILLGHVARAATEHSAADDFA